MAGGARGACSGINSRDIRDDGGETAGPYCRKHRHPITAADPLPGGIVIAAHSSGKPMLAAPVLGTLMAAPALCGAPASVRILMIDTKG